MKFSIDHLVLLADCSPGRWAGPSRALEQLLDDGLLKQHPNTLAQHITTGSEALQAAINAARWYTTTAKGQEVLQAAIDAARRAV